VTVAVQYESALDVDSDIREHLPELVDLVLRTRATRVIELGVRWGTSTLAWLMGLESTDGHLWSVDIARQWQGIDSDRWTFIEGSDLDPVVWQQLPAQADIVFIDTDHRYQLTLDEIDAYRARVRPGGYMVFHDTAVEVFPHHGGGEPPFPVRKAVAERFGSYPWTVFENCNGLIEVHL
jgi:cephalosporin hydroxylase